MNNKKAFTLIELVIGVVISALVLLVVFSFMANIMSAFSKSFQKTAFMTVFYDFVDQVNEYKGVFDNILIIKNSGWNDVLVLYSTWATWVLFWVVTHDSLTLDPADNATIYWNKKIGYKEINEDQVNYIVSNLASPDEIYEYPFFKDKVFADMYIANITLESYNSWALLEMNMDILTHYLEGRTWDLIDELLPEDLFRASLTF